MPKKVANSAKFQYPNKIVDAVKWVPFRGRVPNGGWHSKGKRAYKKAVVKIQSCLHTYKKARLYHLCFIGRTNLEHKAFLKAVVERLKRKGIPNEWFSAREFEFPKGEHLHVFMLVDATDKLPTSVLNTLDDNWLHFEMLNRGIDVRVNPPLNEIHSGARYASLPWLGSSRETTELAKDRYDDAMIWLSYIYKARSKPDDEDAKKNGQVFSSSRPNRKPRTQQPELMAPERPILIKQVLAPTVH